MIFILMNIISIESNNETKTINGPGSSDKIPRTFNEYKSKKNSCFDYISMTAKMQTFSKIYA